MSSEFTIFQPANNHPWAAETLRLIREEILELEPGDGHEPLVLEPDYYYYALCEGEELLGIATLKQLGEGGDAELGYLAIQAHRRREGLGQKMLTNLERVAREMGLIIMQTYPIDEISNNLFEKNGYQQWNEGSGDLYKRL